MDRLKRKLQEKLAKKNDIMNAALNLFAEKDFHEVTVDEIAERVGVSKGTLYLYFKTKEDIFFSIMQEKTNILYNRLDKTINYEKPFAQCLRDFINSYLMFFQEHKPYFKIIHSEKSRINMDEHIRLHAWGIKTFQMFFEQFVKLIKYGQVQKAIRKIDPTVIAKGLRGILNSFTFQNVFMGTNSSIEKETEQIVDLFLHGIGHNRIG
jgi:TetR/AcrR family transcriptional regulator